VSNFEIIEDLDEIKKMPKLENVIRLYSSEVVDVNEDMEEGEKHEVLLNVLKKEREKHHRGCV
jgi:IS5 family transposase